MSRRGPFARRLGWIALPLGCTVAAAVAGALWEPPSEDSSTVGVWAHNPKQIEQSGVPHFGPPPLEGATFFTNPNSRADDAAVKATGADEAAALSVAREQAIRYVESLTARQDRWLRDALREGGDPATQRARRSALAAPARYELRYETPSTGAGEASAALRGALIGLLVAGVVAPSMLVARRRYPGSRSSDGGNPVSPLGALAPSAGVAAGVLVSAGLVALSSVAAPGVYTFLFIALTFAAAFGYALQGGPRAIRVLLIAVIAIAPLRGALLALADTIDLQDALLTVNAIQPSLIAGGAAAALVAYRSMFRNQPPLLIACWMAIALAALLDFATQTAGLKLYAIGLAQYLVYPTLALLAWPLVQERDRARLVWAFVALGVLVAVSIFLQVAGVEFAEAVRSARRHGGATGSYLHAAIFLGTTAVLTLGALFARWSPRNALLTVAAVGLMVAGMSLTYSRGGFGIAIIGALVLFVTLRGRNRLRLVGVTIAATAVGLALSSAIGPNATQIASRTGAGASVEGDPGNAKRIREMKQTINEYRALPVSQKAFGKGLASTGNAGKLASQEPDPTESYPLKLLVESGAAGLLLVGGVLVWALVRFARVSWAAVDPMLKGVGAAGIGLFAESIIYPTLEVQLIALTWWLLLVLCLKDPAPATPIRPSQPRGAVTSPAQAVSSPR